MDIFLVLPHLRLDPTCSRLPILVASSLAKPNFKPPGNIKSAISSTYLSFDNVDMRKVKEGAYSDKDLARAVNFFLMDKLRKEETLIKNICYRLGRNKDPDIGALLAVTESVGLIVTGEHLALPDDPEEHVRFEGMSSDH